MFISFGFDKSKQFSDALFLCYVAKKRAEGAAGVGKSTQNCFIVEETVDYLFRGEFGLYYLTVIEDAYAVMMMDIKAATDAARNMVSAKTERFLEQVKSELDEENKTSDEKKGAVRNFV